MEFKLQSLRCKHINKHSKIRRVACTVVELEVKCDCCGQVVEIIIET